MSYIKRHLEETFANNQYIKLIQKGMDPAAIVTYADCFVDGGWPEFFKQQDELNRNLILKSFPLIDWYDFDDFPYEILVTRNYVDVTFVG